MFATSLHLRIKVNDITNYNLHKYNSNTTLESGDSVYKQNMLALTMEFVNDEMLEKTPYICAKDGRYMYDSGMYDLGTVNIKKSTPDGKWKNADEETQKILLEQYWKNIAKVAATGLFTWMAHIDLPKKVGLGRADKWAEFESRAVESAAKSKTAIEINTSFYRPDCYEPYPSNQHPCGTRKRCPTA